MANETLLVLSGDGVAPYSARGLTQTFAPIEASKSLRRSINGSLKDLSQVQFRKWASTISCADQLAPALDKLWPGQILEVDCAAELSYKVGGSPGRPVVDTDSSDPSSGEALRVEGNYVYYRPRLTMRVVNHNQQFDEWGCVVQWSLELEEV
jgi:hypothetical protein